MADKLKVKPEVTIAGYKRKCGQENYFPPRKNKKDEKTSHTGRVSVMLPLPDSTSTNTGLPVIVNGFFALSDNRRELKWKASDDHSIQAKWNSELLDFLVPVCYAEFKVQKK